jgi:hypothetical protein
MSAAFGIGVGHGEDDRGFCGFEGVEGGEEFLHLGVLRDGIEGGGVEGDGE